MKSFIIYGGALIVLFLVSCRGHQAPTKEDPLARVYNNYLYKSDLTGIGKGLSAKDSAYQADIYIDKWIMDQLVLGVALQNTSKTEEDRINRLVNEYRASLTITSYEQLLIDRELDTIVTPLQLAAYYTQNKEQYISGIDWIRCHFIKVPRSIEGLTDLRRWFKSNKESDIEKVKQFCIAQGNKVLFALEQDRWIRFDRITSQLPNQKIANNYLSPKRVYDRSDDNYVYLFKTFEYRDKEEPTPLSQLQDEISRIIMHQRRKRILDELRRNAKVKAKAGTVYEKF